MDKSNQKIDRKKKMIDNYGKKEIIKSLPKEIYKESNKKGLLLTYISLVKIISAFLVILKHTNRFYWMFNNNW